MASPVVHFEILGKDGGKTITPPTPIPGMGSFAWLSDPDGNCVGIFQPA